MNSYNRQVKTTFPSTIFQLTDIDINSLFIWSSTQWPNPSRVTALTDGSYVEDGSDHRHQQDGAQVVEEQSVGHKVARVQDNRWKHVEEEGIGSQRGDGDIGAEIEHHANDHAHDNQQARFRKY